MNQIGIFVWVSVKACSVGQYIHSIWHRLSLALTKNWRFKTWGFAHKRFESSMRQGFAKSKIGNLCWELHQLQRLIHYFQHVGTCWTLDTFHIFQWIFVTACCGGRKKLLFLSRNMEILVLPCGLGGSLRWT